MKNMEFTREQEASYKRQSVRGRVQEHITKYEIQMLSLSYRLKKKNKNSPMF
jgi:hypothetical protein